MDVARKERARDRRSPGAAGEVQRHTERAETRDIPCTRAKVQAGNPLYKILEKWGEDADVRGKHWQRLPDTDIDRREEEKKGASPVKSLTFQYPPACQPRDTYAIANARTSA